MQSLICEFINHLSNKALDVNDVLDFGRDNNKSVRIGDLCCAMISPLNGNFWRSSLLLLGLDHNRLLLRLIEIIKIFFRILHGVDERQG